jgi:23S rRNA (adenine2503-C2)-methyltransferase
MDKAKNNIRNLRYSELVNYFKSINEQKFRANQVYNWIWGKGVGNFYEMQNMSKQLVKLLSNNFYIDKINQVYKVVSKDRTTKFLFEAVDGKEFEGVIIPGKDRVTACISTQAGCPLNCKFCATGRLGFNRNLTIGEIFDQIFILNKLCVEIFEKKLSNVVVMGMGEPLLNYENIIGAINIVCSEESLGISPQRITLSTAGISPQIKQLADDNIKFNLSISLHSADNKKRSEIMPINKKYDLMSLREAIRYFHSKTKTRVTYEYLMLNGINDSLEDAKKLTEFTKISPCKINIIEYNANDGNPYKATNDEKLNAFVKFLESKNLIVTVRKSKGKDISAACGQLANKCKNFNM